MSLLPVDDAIARIVAEVSPTPGESIALADASGRVLAEPVAAFRTQPPFDASSMDGYAVRGADTSPPDAKLKVIGESHAGRRFGGEVGPGEAVRIFTGAPVPPGADAILIQENTERLDAGTVLVRQPVAVGRNIRVAGLDFKAGSSRLSAGRRLTIRDVALAAAMNHPRLTVRRRPVIAIFATGDELVPPGGTPGEDQIIASTSVALSGMIAEAGGHPMDLGIVPDDLAMIEAAIEGAMAAEVDVLVTVGGASVGERDFVRDALASRGMSLDFWRIAMRPGMPLVFGRLGEMRVIGLPGNPVSSLVCATLFLRPLISALLGEPLADPSEPAVTGADLKLNDHRQDYLRARLEIVSDGLPRATPIPVQDSSMLSALASADCLLIRPPHAPAAPTGTPCRIIRLR